jgi:glycosyltransferase involved in cell wall biosynthesis
MTRILYIGSGTPWTGGAGYLLRQSLFLRALSEAADELHLALFDTTTNNRPPFDCGFTALPSPIRLPVSRLKQMLEDATSPEPRMLRGYDLAPARQAVAALKPETFDAVFAFRIDFGHFAGVLDHPRLILDIDDPEHVRSYRRILASGHNVDRRTHHDLDKLRAFEFNAVAHAQLSLVCQEHETRGWPRTPRVVPNCVEIQPHPPRNVVDPPRVLFVGNCASGPLSPNVDAVSYFLASIWPKVLYSVPKARFQIVGAMGDYVRKFAAGAANVELAGFVDDLAGEYAQAAFSIAPIRFGTGTRVKIIEAFAHACPVVSTLAGAEGIPAIPGREIELAATPTELVSRCIYMLKDAALRQRIGQGGYALAQRLYDRRALQPQLVKMIHEFLETHRAPQQRAAAAAPTDTPSVSKGHGSAVGPAAVGGAER